MTQASLGSYTGRRGKKFQEIAGIAESQRDRQNRAKFEAVSQKAAHHHWGRNAGM
jgi:hypothetical protein